jgi:hypothetical protein
MCTLCDAADVNPVPIKFLRHALQRVSQELGSLQGHKPYIKRNTETNIPHTAIKIKELGTNTNF